MTRIARTVPDVTFPVRIDDDESGFRWGEINTESIFAGRRVLVFSLPGAFTPTCSLNQLPGFEENYNRIRNAGIDEIYCISVNDAFVMNAWKKLMDIQHVKVIPDGSGNFTRFMGMLIGKNHLGFGLRSWRYMCVINNGVIEKWWQEPGINNDGDDNDPYGETTPQNCCEYLENV